MRGLLRKKDVVEALGVAKSTVSDWMIEFHVYIPTVKDGGMTYYKPETLDVLYEIKRLRDEGYAKVQIMKLLAERGFPITVEDAVQDVQELVRDGSDYKGALLTVMQTMGQAVVQIGEQTDRLDRHEDRLDGQDGRMIEMEMQLAKVIQELAVTKEQLDEMKKPWWERWRRRR